MKIEIKNLYNEQVIFTADVESMKECVLAAIKSRANLRGADLRWADLSGADLRWADLSGADLSRADLRWANLRGADLRWANLRGADLSGANLSEANLRGANLSGADLSGADLSGANLHEANLRGADLSGANLSEADLRGANLSEANLRGADLRGADLSVAQLAGIKADFWSVLSSTPREVPGLITALVEGRVNGSQYEGECSCLVGTIASVRHVKYNAIATLPPDSDRPAERWFLGIKQGDTPETNQISKLSVDWAREWLSIMTEAFSVK